MQWEGGTSQKGENAAATDNLPVLGQSPVFSPRRSDVRNRKCISEACAKRRRWGHSLCSVMEGGVRGGLPLAGWLAGWLSFISVKLIQAHGDNT